jgi:hypothetical protein
MHEHRTEELRDDIGHARDDFAATMDEIVNHRLEAREQLRRHPVGYTLTVSGLSIAVGLLLGVWLGRRSTSPRVRPPRFLIRL